MNYKVGDTLGGYTILAECGKGAYGSVFLAENTLTKQQVALKIIYHAGRNSDRELKGLIKYQNLCKHTNLLQIYHVEGKENFFFYTMDAADNRNTPDDYVPDTLAKRLKENGRLTPEVVKKMAQELLADLKELHSTGLFHRDIKPDNILWIDGKATLGDIGLVTDSSQTILAGTPGFISPEVIAGTREFEAKDDFYALGKTIYCAVTGLPVSQYPEFPESGTLTGTGELIQLYNNLCDGESAEFFSSRQKSNKSKTVIAILCLLAIIISTTGVFAIKKNKQAHVAISRKEKKEPISLLPKTASPTKPVEKIELKPYVPSQEMIALLPRLRKYHQILMSELYKEIGNAVKNITQKDKDRAEKYLEKHPTHHLAAFPEALVITLKQEEIREKFAAKYKHEPILEYFDNLIEMEAFQSALAGKAMLWKISVAETRKKLAELYKRQYELEYYILKKHQKSPYSE